MVAFSCFIRILKLCNGYCMVWTNHGGCREGLVLGPSYSRHELSILRIREKFSFGCTEDYNPKDSSTTTVACARIHPFLWRKSSTLLTPSSATPPPRRMPTHTQIILLNLSTTPLVKRLDDPRSLKTPLEIAMCPIWPPNWQTFKIVISRVTSLRWQHRSFLTLLRLHKNN